MALKKFTEFNKLDQKNLKLQTSIEKLGVDKPSEKGIGDKKVSIKKEKTTTKDKSVKGPDDKKAMKTQNLNYGKVIEDCIFIGKTVKFPDNYKPSQSYKLLENQSISKDKLHYIVSKQHNNSLAIIKYNESANKNLIKFVNQVIEYYKKDNSLKILMEQIVIEGSDKWAVLKNIPDQKLANKTKLIDILVNDLTKLLK